MASKKMLTLKDDKGRNINWQILSSRKIACNIKKGTEVFICKNGNRYNLLWEEK